MNNHKLKAWFITPAIVLTFSLLVHALANTFADGLSTAWLGAAMAVAPLPILIGYLMLIGTARTSARLPWLTALALTGLLLSVLVTMQSADPQWRSVAVAATGVLILIIYVYWYSSFERQPRKSLAVGEPLPEFSVVAADGTRVTSADLTRAPAVLLFYRGNWCPLCMTQIREIAARYHDLAEMGVTVALISPQPAAYSQKLARKFDVPLRFLVDRDNRVAEQLGIDARDGTPKGVPGAYAADTVMPTVIVVAVGGEIIFADQTDNYRVRPEPETFIEILRNSQSAQGVAAQ